MNIMPRRNIAGYTLLELMMTVAILAIITSIAIPAYNNYISTSRNAEGQNNLASIRLAQEEYYLENNRYFPDPDGTVSTTASTISTYWVPTETNDADRNFDYSVTTSSNGQAYVATATGRGGTYKVPASVSFSISN